MPELNRTRLTQFLREEESLFHKTHPKSHELYQLTDLLDEEDCAEWILEHFHPKGLKCPKCKRGVEQSRKFRRTQTSALDIQRCKHCGTIYNLYTGTVFQGSQWTPQASRSLHAGHLQG